MQMRAARAALLWALFLVVVGTVFCADDKQRATAFVVDDDSDDDWESAGVPLHRAVQFSTPTVRQAPAQHPPWLAACSNSSTV